VEGDQAVEEARPPVGPPPATISRMMLIWRVALALLLAIAAMNTAASFYYSQQTRWPRTPGEATRRTGVAVEKAAKYVDDLSRHLGDAFKSDAHGPIRLWGVHERIILSLAILALIGGLLMESKVAGDVLAANPSQWRSSRAFAFELVSTMGLAGILAWIAAVAKTNDQLAIVWLFVTYLVAHGVWMLGNVCVVRRREAPGAGRCFALALNSFIFAGILIAGTFFVKEFRDEINTATAASLVCLAGSVIGFRIIAESFFGGERRGKFLRHLAFIIVCLALLALVALTILARKW
jgi:hypothetical protein